MASTHSKIHAFKALAAVLLFFSLTGLASAQETTPPAEVQAPAPAPAKEPNQPSTKGAAEANQTEAAPKTDSSVAPALSEAERAEAEARKAAAEAEAKRAAAAAEAARIAEAKRIEAERTWFDKLLLNSKLYTGLNAGVVIPLNSLHSTGTGFGMTIDYLAYQRYGLHFGAETGLLPAKKGTLLSGASSITISDQGTMGYLNLRFAALYAFPKIFDVDTAAGLGLSVYRVNSGTYNFNTAVAPVIMGTAYYSVLPYLQVGLIAQVVAASASRLSSASTEYTLDSSQSLATASLQASVRYIWF